MAMGLGREGDPDPAAVNGSPMSPPTIVLSREQVDIPVNCPVIEVVQYECAFYEGEKEFTCRPFARQFRVCNTALGVRRYEITDGIKETTKEMLSLVKRS